MMAKCSIVAISIVLMSLACSFPKAPTDEEILSRKAPPGTISVLVEGKEIYGEYGLHDDWLEFREHVRPSASGWVVVSKEWRVDAGPFHDFDDCQQAFTHKRLNCKWKNPHDQQYHNIFVRAYFGRVRPLRNAEGKIVTLENGEIATDTLVLDVPATNVLKVYSFKR